jgi:hypothetical protein
MPNSSYLSLSELDPGAGTITKLHLIDQFSAIVLSCVAFVEEGTVTFRAERLLDENRRLKERS